MARIPQKFIDDLLDRVDIVDVVDRRVKLRKTGKNFSACCPFHDEKTPSFSVNPEKQFFYCFGCGAGGNAVGVLMDYERMEFPQAVDSLAQMAGMEVPREETRPGTAPSQDSRRPLYDQLEQSARFYEHALRKHPEAKRAVAYLKGRGLTGEVAKAFRVGFAPPGWDNLLGQLGQTGASEALLSETGMLVTNDKDRTYDRFRDRIMFPILDARGRVIAFGGRVLGDDKPKYLNSPETPVFQKSRELYGLYQARKNNRQLTRIVVVEGYMDVIALAQHGIGYAVATLGTATSETHLERLFRLVPEVIFCFDGDEAGRKAAFRALEAALPVLEDGRQARFLFLPEGEDPDTVVRAKGQGHLEHLFDNAQTLDGFLFDQLAEGIDLNALDGRARFSKRAAPYVQRLPEGVFRTLLFQELANRTGIDVESLKRLQAPPPEPTPAAPAHSASDDRGSHGGSPSGYFTNAGPETAAAYDGSSAQDYPPPGYADDSQFTGSGMGSGMEGPPDDSLAPSSSNPIHRLLGLLVLNPTLAQDVDLMSLPNTERADGALLREFMAQIQAEPQSSTAALLGYRYGTTEGQLLTELAGREPLEDEAGQAALFTALLERLTRAEPLAQLRQRVEQLKAADYSQLSADEKRELVTLTRELRELKGKN